MNAIGTYCTETYPFTYKGDPAYPEFYCVGPDWVEGDSTLILWVDFADHLPCDMATIYLDGVNDGSIAWFINSIFSLGTAVIKRVTIWDDEKADMQVISQTSKYAH